MKIEIINHPDLTSTMRRTRSGRTQLFREPNIDNEFTNADNAQVILEHSKKSVYAELIDNEWWWVEGCAECNGDERGWSSYIECDEHNVCRTCSKPSVEVKTRYGGRHGWQCEVCHEEERQIKIKEGKAKMCEMEEWDFEYMDQVICPNCGSIHDDVYEDEDIECYLCNVTFHVEAHMSISYSVKLT
jgi:hypothetical protein